MASPGSGPFHRQRWSSKGKGKSKGWAISEEAMESIAASSLPTGAVLPSEPPPLNSDQRPAWIQEVKEWLRTSCTLAELEELSTLFS